MLIYFILTYKSCLKVLSMTWHEKNVTCALRHAWTLIKIMTKIGDGKFKAAMLEWNF